MSNTISRAELEPVLYGFWLSPFMSIVAHLLEEAEIEYQYQRVSPFLGETHSKEHKERNSFGKIPSLRDRNGIHVSESQAICKYIARTYPQARAFYPCDDAVKCAEVDEKNSFITFSISGPFFNWFLIAAYFPKVFNIKTEKESHVFGQWSVFLVKGSINRLISGSKMSPFLLGSSPTLPDFHLFYILELGKVFSKIFDMPAFDLIARDPSLQDFYAAMSLRPATQKILKFQANELELTKSELFENFAESYEDAMTGVKVVLQRLFGHEV